MHGGSDLTPLECVGENPAHRSNVSDGNGEGDIPISVNRILSVGLGVYLLAELLAELLKEYARTVVGVIVAKVLLGDLAQLHEEPRDGLEEVAADRLGDELVPWVVRLWGEFEAHLVSFG